MKRAALLCLLLASFSPGTLFAQMNYSAFEINLADVDINQGPFNVDGDGFEIAGSYEVSDKIFVFGRWQDQDLDFGIDGRKLEFGGGLHLPINDRLDFVATLSYLDLEAELGNLSADDDGLALGAGVRGRVSDSVQVDLGLKLIDLDDSGSDTGITLGGRYYFTDRLAVAAGAEFTDDIDTFSVGFRAEF